MVFDEADHWIYQAGKQDNAQAYGEDMIQKFEATWESLKNYSVPEWYQDAKFGIFIHWDVYSVPAFANEWYPRNMYLVGTAVFDVERGGLKGIRPHFWQTDTAVGKNSWCYVKNPDYKTSTSLIHDLVDIVSKNGALLLYIGPRPDGTIPEGDGQILLDIGRWLAINGEAIYGTRPWNIFGEGPTEVIDGAFQDTKRAEFTSRDVRLTTKGETLYAIILDWPESGEMVIESVGASQAHYPAPIRQVSLLGTKETVQWSRVNDGLKVKLPAEKPCAAAFTLKIESR